MFPDVGISRPANSMSKVLLPQPLGPIMTRNSPCRAAKLTLSSATTSRGVPAPQTLVTFVQTISPMPRPLSHHCLARQHQDSHSSRALPPEHTLLDQAKPHVQEVANDPNHRHPEERQVHVHHLPSDHDDRP